MITQASSLLHVLQAYSENYLERVSQLKPVTAINSSTESKRKSNDDLQTIVEKSNTDENYNITRMKRWFLLIARKYYALMENKLLMFCVVACSFICIIQFLLFIIYWTDIVPRKTQRAIDNRNYDYLTTHLKEQCVPYEKILDQCVL